MTIEFDDDKRARTLGDRGLDMARCDEVFGGATLTVEDDRRDYGERRFITIGFPGSPDGGARLDAARQCAADHKYEEGQ